jgi:hypothetical protein
MDGAHVGGVHVLRGDHGDGGLGVGLPMRRYDFDALYLLLCGLAWLALVVLTAMAARADTPTPSPTPTSTPNHVLRFSAGAAEVQPTPAGVWGLGSCGCTQAYALVEFPTGTALTTLECSDGE